MQIIIQILRIFYILNQKKFLQLLEQFNDPKLQELWDHHRITYIIFYIKEEKDIIPEYDDFAHIIAELRTKEYNIIKKCAEILNPDLIDIEEIPTVDIHPDFSQKECYRCKKYTR